MLLAGSITGASVKCAVRYHFSAWLGLACAAESLGRLQLWKVIDERASDTQEFCLLLRRELNHDYPMQHLCGLPFTNIH
jgi:hypothetical protein